MGPYRLSWETRQTVRRLAGAVMVLMGAGMALRFLPVWVWMVAGGIVMAWGGVSMLRDR